MKAVHKITVPTPYSIGPVNIYIYQRGDRFVLIDAAIQTEESWDLLQQSLREHHLDWSQLDGIMLTHHHKDHIGLINRIVAVRDVPVYVNPKAIPLLIRDIPFLSTRLDFFQKLYHEMGCGETGVRFIEQSRENLHNNQEIVIHAKLVPIIEGMHLEYAADLQIIETPGHSQDHLIFFDREKKWLFAGDHLLEHVSSNAIVEPDHDWVRMKTVVMYRDSLQKLQKLMAHTLFPGHGEPFHEADNLVNVRLARMEKKAERIRDQIADTARTAAELAQNIYPNEYESQFHLVMSEIVGLLDYLDDNGRIDKVQRNGIWYFHHTSR